MYIYIDKYIKQARKSALIWGYFNSCADSKIKKNARKDACTHLKGLCVKKKKKKREE